MTQSQWFLLLVCVILGTMALAMGVTASVSDDSPWVLVALAGNAVVDVVCVAIGYKVAHR